jgi:ribosomal protein L23
MNMERLMRIILAPVVSEKSNGLAERGNRITLWVLKNATKKEIKAAVETLFETEVIAVNTVRQMGKTKRFGRYIGKRQDSKKAYITLAPGQNLNVENATKLVE